MTLEEAMERIKELEEENDSLRGNRKQWRPILPDDAVNIAPFAYKIGSGFESIKLSHVIRTACFPIVPKQRKARHGGGYITADYPIALLDMTDKQYESYCEAMRSILKALAKCREQCYVESEQV